MQKWILSVIFICSLFYYGVAFSASEDCLVANTQLTHERVEVIKQYLNFVSQGKYKEALGFFSNNAMVSDTVTGLKTAKNYYNELYSYLTGPRMTLYDIYAGLNNPNVFAAHFNMKITTSKGIENRGEIVDLFVFEKNSAKIAKLYIEGNKTAYPFSAG